KDPTKAAPPGGSTPNPAHHPTPNASTGDPTYPDDSPNTYNTCAPKSMDPSRSPAINHAYRCARSSTYATPPTPKPPSPHYSSPRRTRAGDIRMTLCPETGHNVIRISNVYNGTKTVVSEDVSEFADVMAKADAAD
ncbi:hypothetical protein GORBP_087_00010, partial [Gordonia rubripertincta NBRC 101908]